ncbi:uncharacterized protein LOC127718062 [Mytilus californianus]|uniref:uncharacterized protein LOC127718062 n=1 Tax=Mytilus californianus TaxID=6549 RepID=UPI00224501D8|nr:uncharacterized protein LOC127718062 [Mytilus californianus]
MSAILALLAITVQIKMVSGIGNDTINVKVQKCATAVFKCSSSGAGVTWLGPDINNDVQNNLVYFADKKRNPKLNQGKYVFHENKGGYELIITNFQKGDIGFYFCRFNNDGLFYETKYNVYLEDRAKETTTTNCTAQSLGITTSFPMIIKTTNFQFPKNQQGNNEQTLVILLVMIPVVLFGGCITIVGLAKVKGTSIDEMLRSFLFTCRRVTKRHASNEEINEQDNTVENQMYQNSNVQPNGNSSETEIPFPDRTVHDADLDVSDDTGATSNYRNTTESTAVKLYECTPGLHYAEVSIKQVGSQQIKIHGIENRTIYTGIDHSLNRVVVQSDYSDNDSEDDFIFIQNLDVNSRNYENTCL